MSYSKTILDKCKSICLTLFLFLFILHYSQAQCAGTDDVAVCNITCEITNIENAEIITSNSTIDFVTPGQTPGVGTPFEIRATSSEPIVLNFTIDYDWPQVFNLSWFHGASAYAENEDWGFTSGGDLGAGWIFHKSITGSCSGNTYGPGFYNDGTYLSSLECCSVTVSGNAADNWGINCVTECPKFSFKSEYCASVLQTTNSQFGVVLTDDGESGCWALSSAGAFYLSFPIIIHPPDDINETSENSYIVGENNISFCEGETIELSLNTDF